jgi:hypothetical protein
MQTAEGGGRARGGRCGGVRLRLVGAGDVVDVEEDGGQHGEARQWRWPRVSATTVHGAALEREERWQGGESEARGSSEASAGCSYPQRARRRAVVRGRGGARACARTRVGCSTAAAREQCGRLGTARRGLGRALWPLWPSSPGPFSFSCFLFLFLLSFLFCVLFLFQMHFVKY